MARVNRFYHYLYLFFLVFIFTSCENPLKEEKKKEPIRILLHEILVETGRYIIYWNGKDDNGKYVSPGKYIYLLEVKSLQDQGIMNAIQGGKPEENNEGRFEPGTWIYTELQPSYPEPFKVLAGVNIPFTLSYAPVTVKLSVYEK